MKSIEQYAAAENEAIVKRMIAERKRTARAIVREFIGDMFGTQVKMTTPSIKRNVRAIEMAMEGERR